MCHCREFKSKWLEEVGKKAIYASMAGINRPLSKRGEKTGSLTHFDRSQKKNRAPVAKARTSVDMMVGLFQ